jgi:hypothetical protein
VNKCLGCDNVAISDNEWCVSCLVAIDRANQAAIERVREFCNDAIEYGQYIIRAENVLKALDGEQK